MSRPSDQSTDLSRWKEAEGAKRYRSVIRTAERILKNGEDYLPKMIDALQSTLEELKTALILNHEDEADEAEEQLRELLELIREDKE